MQEVAAVIGAFFLFVVGFPLIGLCAGVFVRILLPYLCGGALVYLLMEKIFIPTGAWWEFTVPLLAWAALIYGTRLIDSPRWAWHEGHWHAVLLTLTFGLWRRFRRLPTLVDELDLSPAEGV